MDTIEVELRSFITPERYEELVAFFTANGTLVSDDEQVTDYFDCKDDIRMQKNSGYAKIWRKGGAMHDAWREETEVRFQSDDFEKLQEVFAALGIGVKVRWFRHRKQFEWQGITVCLDHTRGYGHIIELEKMTSHDGKDAALVLLRQKLVELGVALTPKEEFDARFKQYLLHWRELTNR